MADMNTLKAVPRNEFGKGASRRLRREGQIPAVLYGHGSEPMHLALPGHETFLIIRHSRNAVIELELEGDNQLALVKDVQINPVIREIEHIDLILVRKGEKVLVNVPVVTEGESAPGTIHSVETMELAVTASATNIPEEITVSIEGLEDGTVVRVGDLELPEGVTTEVDPESPVVVISIPREEPEEDEEAAEGEEGAEAGEAAAEDAEEGGSEE